MTVSTFTEHRSHLFGIAYRMLGSAASAEDAVQEAWLRWESSDGVDNPRAWLTTVVTRLCLDELKSARARRETYIGPWLPEPVTDMPIDRPELHESLSMAFLVLLERLTPPERAAFLLREVFDRDYAEIGHILEREQADCRQLVSRAKGHIDRDRRRFDPDTASRDALVMQFATACMTGDAGALEALLTDQVTVWSDGGGKVNAARRAVHGPDRVTRLLIGLAGKLPADATHEPALINGQPGVITRIAGRVYAVLVLDIVGGQIAGVRNVVNPEKLGAI